MFLRGDVVVRAWKGSGMRSGSGEREETSLRVIESEEEDMSLVNGFVGGLRRGLGFDDHFFCR